MKLTLTLLFTFLFSLGFSQVVDTTQLNIVSWNIQNFGRSKSASDSVIIHMWES